MGIYDRDYYRREGPSFLGSFTERGTMCKWLIGINIIAFVLQMLSKPAGQDGIGDLGPFSQAFLLDPVKVLHGEIWRLLTYAFLHSPNDPYHILWNMLFLFWFGSDMEDLYGPREFLTVYLVSALLGGVVHVLLYLAGWFGASQTLGASGAVTTVLVLCAIHYPTRVIYLFFFLPIPIWFFVVFSVGIDFFKFLAKSPGGVAVDVHLAGALFAYVYYKRHWRLISLVPDIQAWRKRRSQPRLRVFRPEDIQRETVGAAVAAPSIEDEQLEAKVDAILEKISRTGKESLTENEKQTLLRASELIKRRRR